MVSDDDDDNRIERCKSRFFLQSPHCALKCLQHARSSGLGAIKCEFHSAHRALVTFNMSCARCYKGKVCTIPTGAYRFVDLGKSEIRPYRSLDLGNSSLQSEVKSL